MKKFHVPFTLAVLFFVAGCVPVFSGDGTRQIFLMTQVGVIVQVVNNCAPLLDVERVNGLGVRGLRYGESVTIPLVSTPFSGSNRQMALTAKGYSTGRVAYLGSLTATFYVSTDEGSREAVWEVDSLNLPSGRGGCV